MLDQIFSIVFFPFSMDIVLYCCAFTLVTAIFGLVRRFILSDYSFER